MTEPKVLVVGPLPAKTHLMMKAWRQVGVDKCGWKVTSDKSAQGHGDRNVVLTRGGSGEGESQVEVQERNTQDNVAAAAAYRVYLVLDAREWGKGEAKETSRDFLIWFGKMANHSRQSGVHRVVLISDQNVSRTDKERAQKAIEKRLKTENIDMTKVRIIPWSIKRNSGEDPKRLRIPSDILDEIRHAIKDPVGGTGGPAWLPLRRRLKVAGWVLSILVALLVGRLLTNGGGKPTPLSKLRAELAGSLVRLAELVSGLDPKDLASLGGDELEDLGQELEDWVDRADKHEDMGEVKIIRDLQEAIERLPPPGQGSSGRVVDALKEIIDRHRKDGTTDLASFYEDVRDAAAAKEDRSRSEEAKEWKTVREYADALLKGVKLRHRDSRESWLTVKKFWTWPGSGYLQMEVWVRGPDSPEPFDLDTESKEGTEGVLLLSEVSCVGPDSNGLYSYHWKDRVGNRAGPSVNIGDSIWVRVFWSQWLKDNVELVHMKVPRSGADGLDWFRQKQTLKIEGEDAECRVNIAPFLEEQKARVEVRAPKSIRRVFESNP